MLSVLANKVCVCVCVGRKIVCAVPVATHIQSGSPVVARQYVDEVVIGAPFHTSEELIKHFKVDIVIVGKAGEPPLVVCLLVLLEVSFLHTSIDSKNTPTPPPF